MVAPFGLLFAVVSSEAGLKVCPSAAADEPGPACLVAALPAFSIGIGVKSVSGAVFGAMLGLYAMQLLIA